MIFEKELEKEIEELEGKVAKINKYLMSAPNGKLRTTRRSDGMDRFYLVYKNGDTQNANKYLSKKKDVELIKALAKKDYYKKLLSKLDKELTVLRRAQKVIMYGKKEQIYLEMGSARCRLVENEYPTGEDLCRRWMKEKTESNNIFTDNLVFQTAGGISVRSKSEYMIASILEQCEDVLCFKYEPKVLLTDGRTTVCPDFVVMRKIDGKKIYWEHFGMMDNPEYANSFIKKDQKYRSNGFIFGSNLIYTFESSENPLTTKQIKSVINMYFEKENIDE